MNALVVFGGLPGTGKTTIAKDVARRTGAVYLRIDTIEQAVRSANVLAGDIGPAGYVVANGVAEDNLRLGRTVIADCVNPVEDSRRGWRSVAAAAGAPLIELEIVCSDVAEHRRRVESRAIDVPGLPPPRWESIEAGGYQPWSRPRLVVDTARLTPDAAAALICAEIERRVRPA